MERILSENDKMRKAEEIYYRRNNSNIKFDTNIENSRKIKTYIGSKILLEILTLVIIAIIVFAIKNKDFIFNKEFLETISAYNIDLSDKFKSFIIVDEENQFTNKVKNEITNEQSENNTVNVEQEVENTNNNQISIAENNCITEEVALSNEKTISNIDELKETIKFQRPIDGIITSRFGSRTSKYKNVGSNHTGIDISADLGTSIKATMNGTVEQVSTEGDYGNHIRIANGNVVTLYAHCQKIYVEEGQEISIGQEIATVGNTGNSTGPHLHFEIRIDDNPIDPTEIIEF